MGVGLDGSKFKVQSLRLAEHLVSADLLLWELVRHDLSQRQLKIAVVILEASLVQGRSHAVFSRLDDLMEAAAMARSHVCVAIKDLRARNMITVDPPGERLTCSKRYGINANVKAWRGSAWCVPVVLLEQSVFGFDQFVKAGGQLKDAFLVNFIEKRGRLRLNELGILPSPDCAAVATGETVVRKDQRVCARAGSDGGKSGSAARTEDDQTFTGPGQTDGQGIVRPLLFSKGDGSTQPNAKQAETTTGGPNLKPSFDVGKPRAAAVGGGFSGKTITESVTEAITEKVTEAITEKVTLAVKPAQTGALVRPITESVTAKTPENRESPPRTPPLRTLNVEAFKRSTVSGLEQRSAKRKTFREESRLMDLISELVGADDMVNSGGFWRVYVVRNLPAEIIEEAVGEGMDMKRTQRPFKSTPGRWLNWYLSKLAGLRSLSDLPQGPPPQA